MKHHKYSNNNSQIMTEERIKELQEEHGYSELQAMINSGQAWHMEGSVGRAAMDSLKAGVCYLPDESHRDYYGSKVPARGELKDGTTGTLGLSMEFWEKVETGEAIIW